MRLSKIVFARICDVQDVSDTKRLDDVRVTCVMPISEVEPAREDLIRVGVRVRRSRYERLTICTLAEVFIVLCNFIKSTYTEVELAEPFVLKCLIE